VLDGQLQELVREILKEQTYKVKNANKYFEDEAAVKWVEETKFLIDSLISSNQIDLKKRKTISLTTIYNEI
jgi:hypothetical protein